MIAILGEVSESTHANLPFAIQTRIKCQYKMLWAANRIVLIASRVRNEFRWIEWKSRFSIESTHFPE